MNISRRKALALIAGGTAGGLLGYSWLAEPKRISVTRHTIGPTGAGRGAIVKIVQISDLHLKDQPAFHRKIAETVNSLEPDVLVITGDVVDDAADLGLLDAFSKLIRKPKHSIAILGNWEHWARLNIADLERLYGSHGVKLLVNKTVRLDMGGRELVVTGLDDFTAGMPSLPQALAGHEPSPNHLLLAHSPSYGDVVYEDTETARIIKGAPEPDVDVKAFRFRAMLSGHTHGGQVTPFGITPITPPGSGRFVRGWYRDVEPNVYVNRGIGTSVLPVRFMEVPEVACFEMEIKG